MANRRLPRIALLWAQFAPYHVDRCIAVARRLEGRAEIRAIEVAARSRIYAWEPAGDIPGVDKRTLFPGTDYETIPPLRRFWAIVRAAAGCRQLFVGIGYNDPAVILASWALTLLGVRVVMMTDSKFDDRDRRSGYELFKRVLLLPYRGVIASGPRAMRYVRFLGFRRRPVLPGYDVVDGDRLRAAVQGVSLPAADDRPFVFVGRFVEKKNLPELLSGYALYAASAERPRRLVLAGSGPLEADLRTLAEREGIAGQVDFPGFLDAAATARVMAGACALLLVSSVEQWGLVVNEAAALGVPAIVSEAVGARDALVRNLVTGFVVERGSPAGIAAALAQLGGDPALHAAMSAATRDRAWLGDVDRLADAVEAMFDPAAAEPQAAIARHLEALGPLQLPRAN